MPPVIIDIVIIVLALGITYALSSEGLWGAALMFFNILFSALIALNFYEPLAGLVAGFGSWAQGYADTFCLMALYVVSLIILRITTDSIAPAMVRFPSIVYHLGRLLFAAGGAVLTMAFLIVAFETAPVHKKIFSVIDYKYKPPFNLGWDHQLLGFFQYTTGYTFASYGTELNDREFQGTNVFDPKGAWLIDHQNARPYGKETVPETDDAPAAGAAPAGGAPAPGGAPAGVVPGRPGPGIPGGTAGAAAGLAPTN